jgi:CheY-like chemotaxis protein
MPTTAITVKIHQDTATPQQRIRRERGELGLDHALLGGLLIRRWGLPTSLSETIEHHHDPSASGEAAIVRLADMLAHYERGASVSPREMLESASALGLEEQRLRGLIYRYVRGHHPGVLVLDLNMPGGSSLEAIPAIREEFPGTQIVVLTMQQEPASPARLSVRVPWVMC